MTTFWNDPIKMYFVAVAVGVFISNIGRVVAFFERHRVD